MRPITFPCFGGPLNGLTVSEQYAGPDYHRYNSADKVRHLCGGCKRGYPRSYQKLKVGPNWAWIHTTDRLGRWVCSDQEMGKPRCVLIHNSIWAVGEDSGSAT